MTSSAWQADGSTSRKQMHRQAGLLRLHRAVAFVLEHDMPHLFELAISNAVGALRAASPHSDTSGHLDLAPGVYLSWDAAAGQVQIDTQPEPEGVLSIVTQVAKSPEWLSFNIELGEGGLGPGDILGLVVDLQSDRQVTLSPFLRTALDGTLLDTPLREVIPGGTTRAVQTVLHPAAPGHVLTDTAGYHTLVVPLAPHDHTLTLFGMRLFIMPARYGFAVHDPVIGQT